MVPGRITDRATFAALARSRARVRRGPVRLSYVDTGAVPVQIGFAVGTKVANAVGRNRIRRRLRAVFVELARKGHPTLPPGGAVLVGAGPQVATMQWHRLVHLVEEALGELANQVAGAEDAENHRSVPGAASGAIGAQSAGSQ